MRKFSKIFLVIGILVIALFVAKPIYKQANSWFNHNHEATSNIKKSKEVHKKVYPKAQWAYPFKRLTQKQVKFKSGQKFGKTDFLRRVKPKSYFHDGYDFGFSEVGHSTVYAVHPGVVHKVKYRPGMDLYIWIISPDGYVQVYQEGFLNDTDIYVKKGQHVKLGQKIGRLTGSHIHLGITKTSKHYIDKHGDPCRNWWRNNGTWLDPMAIIDQDQKRAGKFVQAAN